MADATGAPRRQDRAIGYYALDIPTALAETFQSGRLVSGPRSWSQNWSRAFYECYAEVEGLYSPSSLTNLPAIAIYERVLSSSPFPAAPLLHRALADPLLIDACARRPQ
ncbi:MAG: hypothetical protein F4X36_01050 [Gammaproteobacteria bacterium]|nr:hypothetical protein [Gammaproteobacteria bacterium]